MTESIMMGLFILICVVLLAKVVNAFQNRRQETDPDMSAIEEAARFLSRWNQYDAKKAEEAPLNTSPRAIELEATRLKRLDELARANASVEFDTDRNR